MSEPLSAEEEAKLRESVRLISEDAEGDGWSWWSNTTAARLLATLDAERAASERPPVDPLREALADVRREAERKSPDANQMWSHGALWAAAYIERRAAGGTPRE